MNGWHAWHKVPEPLAFRKGQFITCHSSSYNSQGSRRPACQRKPGNGISPKLELKTRLYPLCREDMQGKGRFIPMICWTLPDCLFSILRIDHMFRKIQIIPSLESGLNRVRRELALV
jgi:hypothetical protein